MTTGDSTSSSRSRAWLRGLLVGPLVLVAACLVLAGAALWIPGGAAQINNLVLPIVFFPLIWTLLFLYACLDRKLSRAFAVVAVLGGGHAALIAMHWMA